MKSEVCGQTALPDRSISIRQQLIENAKVKNSNATFLVIFKQCKWGQNTVTLHIHHLICCIEIDKKSQWGMKSNSYNSSIVILIWPCIPKKFQRFSVFLSEKSAPNPRDHDLDSDDDPSSNNHVLAIWHRQLLFTNPNLDRFEEAQLKMNGIQFRQNCRCVWTKKVGA